jgi:hypothetical protein
MRRRRCGSRARRGRRRQGATASRKAANDRCSRNRSARARSGCSSDHRATSAASRTARPGSSAHRGEAPAIRPAACVGPEVGEIGRRARLRGGRQHLYAPEVAAAGAPGGRTPRLARMGLQRSAASIAWSTCQLRASLAIATTSRCAAARARWRAIGSSAHPGQCGPEPRHGRRRVGSSSSGRPPHDSRAWHSSLVETLAPPPQCQRGGADRQTSQGHSASGRGSRRPRQPAWAAPARGGDGARDGVVGRTC